MLEFLGLEDEAVKVFIGCILMGLALGIQMGAMAGYPDRDENAKTPVGQLVLLVACILTGAAGFLLGIIPGILLFITFQWKYIIFAVLLGIVITVPTYFLLKWVVLARRRAKYMRNPIVKEAVEFCRQNRIVGIQCFPDGIRFFMTLNHPDYCKRSVSTETKSDHTAWQTYKGTWKRPDAWAAYDHGCVKVIRFSDRNFPNVPDLPMFAGALAKKLGDFAYAEHKHAVQYDTVTTTGNTCTTTHHIAVLHEDCFVYSRKAYREAQKARRDLTLPADETPKPPQPKQNTWE